MNDIYTDAFWKAVSETAVSRGLIDAAIIVYCRVHKMTISECCAVIGLGSKRVKAVLGEFDRYSASVVPVIRTDPDKLSA